MSSELHQIFVETAKEFSPSLQSDFQRIGPVSFPSRKGNGLSCFLARAIVGQQLSTKVARNIWGRIEDVGNERGCQVLEVFSEDNRPLLQQCGVSRNKIKALCSVRQARGDGRLSLRLLEDMTVAERSVHLQTIWGIGPWTADMASIFFFQDPDVWPEGDATVQKTFSSYIREDGGLDVTQATCLFAPYRSFLALYMWRIADAMP